MARSGNWLFAWFDGVNSSLTVTKKAFSRVSVTNGQNMFVDARF